MSCATCARQMLEIEALRGEGVYGPESVCVAVARMGQEDESIKTCTLKEMCNIDMGGPLHSMVLVGGVLIILGVSLASTNYLIDAEVPNKLFDFVQFFSNLNKFLVIRFIIIYNFFSSNIW